jgi:membrane-bound serine protease (ClpP class)
VLLAIVLVAAALLVVVAEVFFVSFGLLSIVAVSLAAGGVVLGFRHSTPFGWSLLGAVVVGVPLVIRTALRLLPLLPFGRDFQLEPPALEPEAPSPLLGAVGEAVSPLRPAGRALFDGRPLAVVARGPLVRPGAFVRVVEVSGNRVVVEACDAPPGKGPP